MEIPLFIDSLEIVSGKIDCKSSRKNKRLKMVFRQSWFHPLVRWSKYELGFRRLNNKWIVLKIAKWSNHFEQSMMWGKDTRIKFTFDIVSDRFPPHQCFCGFFVESSSLPCGQENSFFFYSSSGYLPKDQNLQFRYHIHLHCLFHLLLHLIKCLLNLVNHQEPCQLIVICLIGAHGVSDLENFED